MRQSLPHLLVETKLNRPALDPKSIPRPRLISLLNEGIEKRLTLISASAGYGKTTLAVQWLAQQPRLAAWLSLDALDSDVDRFLRYLVAAIKAVAPDFRDDINPLLATPALPPLEYLADTMISNLSMIGRPFSVVIDDYHTITHESVQTLVSRMIEYLPANLHMVILTRKDPPWPVGLWRVRGWLNELRAVDLSFTKEEARGFLNPNNNKNLSQVTTDRIQRRAEGWIAGLQMARLSLSYVENPEQFARNFSGSDRMIVDFLMEQVLFRESPEIRDFLVLTAMFERFCAPLCDFILTGTHGQADSGRLIAHLERENLFLVPLDTERNWYRYHHLFQSLLTQHVAAKLSPERKALFHRLAGKWFAKEGLLDESLQHLLAAEDVHSAAELFALNLHHLIQNDLSRRTLMRWVKLFPSGAETEQPVLLVANACYKVYTWDFAGIMSLLDHAESLLRAPNCSIAESVRRILLANIDAMYGFCFYWQGDPENSLLHAQRAFHAIPKGHHWAYTAVIIYTSSSLAATGHYEEAMRFLSDRVAEDCSAGSLNIGTLLAAKAGIQYYAGDLDGVREAAKSVLASHKTIPVPDYWLAHAYYFLGAVAYERNLLGLAANYFGRVEKMIYRVNTRMYHDCIVGLALVAWAEKAPQKAWEYAEKARSFALEMKDPTSLQISDSLNTRLSLIAGKVPAETEVPPVTNDGYKFWIEILSLTRAEYLIKRSPQDASSTIPFIDEAVQRARTYHNARQVIQLLAVKSVALKCTGSLDQALEVLEKTLGMAQPLGFVRTFVDRGTLMAELLNALFERSPGNSYVRRILDAFEGKITSKTEEAVIEPLPDELTHRELDVLIMLAKRLTNKEIAERLFVSSETVKTHLSNMYRKLNVQGRRQAIAEAKRRGLLPSK